MDFPELDFTTTLREAFTCYLKFLSHTRTVDEAKLPRQGKGAETTRDLTSQQYFQTRVAATEICLQYTGRIAFIVNTWAQDPPEDVGEEEGTTLIEDEEPQLEHFMFDDQPFLDVFSGKWIEPMTSFSAGPSGLSQVADESGRYSTEENPDVSVVNQPIH
jgi:hypothetical protein